MGESKVGVEGAVQRLQSVVAEMWAKSTTQQRRFLWDRMTRWVHLNGLEVNADSASLFVLATSVSPQGQLTYCKSLSGLFRHLGLANQSLLSLGAALRAAGAAIPQKQALPIPRDVLLGWAVSQSADVRLCALLAWKTASRWSEVQLLRSDQFLIVSANEVIIDWFVTPKGRRADPFRSCRLVVVAGSLVSEIARLFHLLSPFQRLTHLDTCHLDKTWKKELPSYTAHSIKRGAISHLLVLLARGVPIQEVLVSRLAKHASESGLSPMTLRYGGDKIALARALRTGEVTVHL